MKLWEQIAITLKCKIDVHIQHSYMLGYFMGAKHLIVLNWRMSEGGLMKGI